MYIYNYINITIKTSQKEVFATKPSVAPKRRTTTVLL